jgi:hypothetical protein
MSGQVDLRSGAGRRNYRTMVSPIRWYAPSNKSVRRCGASGLRRHPAAWPLSMERFREHEGARHIVLFLYNKAGSPSRRRQSPGKAESHLATPPMTKTPKRSGDLAEGESSEGEPAPPASRDGVADALDRWDEEGGAPVVSWPLPYEPSDLLHVERRVLECLGGALVSAWNDMPTDVQRRLFEHAASGKSYDAALFKARIARFLHNHKDDYFAWPISAIPAARLRELRSFSGTLALLRPSTKCCGPAIREYRLTRRREIGRR